MYISRSSSSLFFIIMCPCIMFFSARGDNGSQSISNETQSLINSRGTKWQLNLPSAHWWSDMFQRMTRSMKRCLKRLLGQFRIDYKQLYTLLAELETVISNSPLLFLYDEPVEEVLTQNDLLFGRKINLENLLKGIFTVF